MTDKKYVYILSQYDEDGLTTPYATLDRSQLEPLLIKHWPEFARTFTVPTNAELAQEMPWSERSEIEAQVITQQLSQQKRSSLAILRQLLLDDELEANYCCDLGEGWGGIQLYVIELES